ncbi:multidrug efflux RND transporter permease subunit [Pandoraea sp. B-6]|uniref:multidrug efflux RND transporter permease subunit n=1 Tax=Pandoraea sp. B-6 TaxID=1204340 RepID=UPI000349B405|nr:multidrug efflux RND transporter permease subunit [Pandoraea sp. B-6]
MNLSAVFIKRSVATVLLTIGVTLAGIVAFGLLPVSPLPQVDFPTISVTASLPGASPETMAASVATPLERSLGRIAGVTEMTSNSTLGSTRITLQFDLSRDINGAARDVQAAINAARSLLPSGLPSNPTYRKVNPASAPVMILALTSDSMTRGQMYDSASTILAQKISQLDGVGDVTVGGSSLPAVRVELNPTALNKYQIPLETVRTTIQAANANRPKGALEDGDQRWQILANDQAKTAKDYLPVVVSYRDGRPVRLSDVADVVDSVQDLRNAGSANGKPSVVLIITTQPGANIIKTVDGINKILPVLRASIPAAINLDVVMDRTPTIRASLKEVERTLLISIALVIMVVFLFLRNWRATLIPSVAVPVSLIGTFGVMYLCGFSLDNLSLMALTIATGFVVDDAIVVLENIARHIEDGLSPFAAALKGTREVGFTVLSMSISLVAVFIPLLLMGGIVGRLFREFAVTLSAAILVSLVVSLTATPMMCARLLKGKSAPGAAAPPPRPSVWTRIGGWTERMFDGMLREYERSLSWALRHGPLMLGILFATICLNVWLYTVVPKGFFPQQDTGRMIGFIQADQAISFQAMEKKLADFIKIVQADPDVSTVTGFTGGSNRNGGLMFVTLKPLGERKISADQVIARLRGKLAKEPGAMLYLQSVQDIRVGGRASNAQYQYTLQADDLQQLREWEPKVRNALSHLPNLVDVNTDQQDKGLQTTLDVDRDQASRLGLTMSQIDGVLNDAFGQRQVSTIYNPLNQYKVVMEVAPQWWQSPESLKDIYVVTSAGAQVPLSAFARYRPTNTALGVSHQGQFAASTISFNLPPGVSLSQAQASVQDAVGRLGMPTSVHGSFQGTAQAFQSALSSQPILILTALLTVYIVLGVLYESYIHPLTILSTLPSAGVGALLALLLFNTEFSIIALIGVILLIGIVKKNAIMMIDFALDAERRQNMPPREAIYHACVLRFRPIMMTTMAAMLGAIPLALGSGDGAELRQPLGISIVGGLLVSQVLTLYTTPVVYLYLDRLRLRWARWRARGQRGQGDVGEVGHG